MRHETAIFRQKKKTKSRDSSYHFFFAYFFSFNNKNTKNAETPNFIVF